MSKFQYRTPLSAENMAQLGLPDWPFGVMDKVRFSEIDALNHVNNAVYASWLEFTRIAYIMEYGLSSMHRQPPDPEIVVRRQVVDYLKPVFNGEVYTVAMRTTRIKHSSLVMDYGIYVGTELRAAAETVIVGLTLDGTARQTWHTSAIDAMVSRDKAEKSGF